MKFVCITGGVLSGLGKGVITSSIGLLLKSCGYSVTAIKIDPYLNCDAGTMNPYEHGEVFVLADGSEVDLDLGNYERFLDIELSSDHNITTGKVYERVIQKERDGAYLGKTVQIIPHITNEIKNTILRVGKSDGVDVVLIEMGGTVGDIESMPFLEAVRQLHLEVGNENMLFGHTTLVPIMGTVGEQKTKPTQHSVKELRAIGIQPDLIFCRCSEPLDSSSRRKIALFCEVAAEAIFSSHDLKNVYELPELLDRQGVTAMVQRQLGLTPRSCSLRDWSAFVGRVLHSPHEVLIALVGKYTGLKDSYISHIKAMEHAGAELGLHVDIKWVEAESLSDETVHAELAHVDGILIPGGFGVRGIEGKLYAARLAREREIPFLGICLGFQVAAIEFARNVIVLEKANSTEFKAQTPHPVVDLLPEQREIDAMGGTMRLGAHEIVIEAGSRAAALYGAKRAKERHRHRYEINPDYIERFEEAGLIFTSRSPDGRRMEIAELRDHPAFIAAQFHPEFRSRPGRPAPLFKGFLEAAKGYRMREMAHETAGER